MKNSNFRKVAAVSGILVLSGCGGSGSGPAPEAAGPVTGVLNLSISDSPIRDAAKVCIKFDGVELKKEGDGPAIDIDFDTPAVVNLLANQGAISESLVTAEVEAGSYQWIRLKVDAENGSGAGISDADPADTNCIDTDNGSYLVSETGSVLGLWVPSGNQTGLKLIKNITVPANSSGNYTAEWDVGMSFNAPPGLGTGEAMMKPVIKLVANNEVGTLNGTVSGDFFVAQEGAETAMCPADSEFAPMVYVFDEDGNSEVAVNSDGAEGLREPVATGLVSQNVDTVDLPYTYEIGFLLAGNYEVAFSCDDQSTFVPETGKPATIAIGGVTAVDFVSGDLPVEE